jgi:predicted GNAT family acetyltransferase
VIGAVTVHPEHQGRGYGSAISAGLTRLLLDRYGLCCLGVLDGNARAAAIYDRLGYRDVLPLRSLTGAAG